MAPPRQAPRRPVLKDVATRAGVSPSTASLAFSGDPRVAPATRERVLAAAAELGYGGPDPLARSLRQGRSGVVGAVVGDRLCYAFGDPHAAAVLDGLSEELGDLDCGLLLLGGTQDARRRTAQVSAVPLDAVVWASCGVHDAVLDLLLARHVPVVCIEGPVVEGVHLVEIDDEGPTAELVQHLVDLGHVRVATATLPLLLDGRRGPLAPERRAREVHANARRRLDGVERVLRPVAVWEAASNVVEEGEAAALGVLTGPDGELLPAARRPTAVVAQSDLLAVGVVVAARRLGLRVPEDLSVTGFDGIATPWLGGSVLTTVEQPAFEKGRSAGRLVAALLRGESPADVSLPVAVRIGTTTGPAPA